MRLAFIAQRRVGSGLSRCLLPLLLGFALPAAVLAQRKPRAQDLGIPLEGKPGRYNAITDVAGVEVGHTTLISGAGRLVVGKGPIRTGVTAIFPRGKAGSDTVFAGWFTLNGNGEMTGTTWVEESGFLEGPVVITNTHSVGIARDAVIQWMMRHRAHFEVALPVVAETWDGALNDINGFHVTREDVFAALDGASSGPVVEGNVGGGTGMVCHQFKGGIGTASRKLSASDGGYIVGVLVQCNYGERHALRVAGVPIGEEISDDLPCLATTRVPSQTWMQDTPRCERVGSPSSPGAAAGAGDAWRNEGSIIIVVATDAPLLPHQLERVARRAALGVAKTGGIGNNSSGDIFIAFSTANRGAATNSEPATVTMLPNERIDPIFAATVQATEEAILNAMLAAETMTGADDYRVTALPHDRLVQALQRYNRLATGAAK